LLVAQDLHFDMSRPRDEALKVKTAVTEGGARFRDRFRDLFFKLGRCLRHTDASAAAARRRLDHERIAYVCRGAERGPDTLNPPVRSRHGSHAGACCDLARHRFVPHRSDRLRLWADENQPGRLDLLSKFGVLRKEAVAWMHRVGAARDRSRDDDVFVQVRFCRVRWTNLDRFIGEPGGQHILVGRACSLSRPDPQGLSSADDPNGDLAPMGDKKFLNRHGSVRLRGRRWAGPPSRDPRSQGGKR
jgi:hypothetical protein